MDAIKRLNILFVICVWCCALSGCGETPPGRTAVAFYNCELLYDTVDNPLTEDDDFTPAGKNKYGTRLYHQKLHHMAVVLQSMKDAPVIVGVAEVENESVLRDLTQQPELLNREYSYLLHQGEDRRGMNVGLLYSAGRFKVLSSSITSVPLSDTEKTRGILTVQGVLDGDTLYVVVNHWPSRRGGVEETAGKREMAATILRTITEAIQSRREEAQILLMGDFNDNPKNANIAQFLGAYDDPERVQDQGFYNPFAELYAVGEGTEVYQHQWNLFDQIIVSGTLLRDGRLRYVGAEIYKPAFLQSKHKDHKGEPYRSWLGSRWINGYSDHFPVVIYLSKSDR